jgi:hypothetical protein
VARPGKCIYRIKTMAGCGTSLGESAGSKQILCYNLVCYWWVFLFLFAVSSGQVVQFRLRYAFSYRQANSLSVWDHLRLANGVGSILYQAVLVLPVMNPPNPCEGSPGQPVTLFLQPTTWEPRGVPLKGGSSLWGSSHSCDDFLGLHIDLDQLENEATP